MTDCQHITEDLKAYCDHELPLLRRLAVRRHLSHCAACREEITFMQQFVDDLRTEESNAANAQPLDADLRERLLDTVANTQPAPITRPQKAHRLKPILLGGGALTLIVAGFALQNMGSYSHMLHSPSQSFGHLVPPERQMSLKLQQSVQDYDGNINSLRSNGSRRFFGKSNVDGYVPAQNGNNVVTYTMPVTISGNSISPIQTYDAAGQAPSTPGRTIHKEANLGIEVADPEATGDQITEMAKSVGGFMANTTLSTGDDGLKTSDLTIKVPVTQFEPTLAAIAKLGKVLSKDVTGEDITEKVSDADQAESVMEDEVSRSDAQLKQLGPRAKWRDQEAARDLRIQLAQAQARLQLLKKMGRLSTLTVNLTQKAKSAPPIQTGFTVDLKNSGQGALQSVLSAFGTLLSMLIWILVYAPLWVPLALITRWAVRAYQRRTMTSNAP